MSAGPETLDPAAVVFDVDGTLYDQRALRRRMLVELAAYCAARPWRIPDLRLIALFRRERERRAHERPASLESAQYEWAAAAAGARPERVREVIEHWMERAPLRHLARCRHAGVVELFRLLGERSTRIAVFSDYPAREKLAALGLEVDCVVSALDPEVNRLKPDPTGLVVAAQRLRVPVERCLMVGDRDDRDGEAARAAGMPFLLFRPRAGAGSGPGNPAGRGGAAGTATFCSFAELAARLGLAATAGA
jgi:phosphoglycolate phosphatase/putative hydrolase of the HAD superfamily